MNDREKTEPRSDAWDARDIDIEGRINGLPFLNVNGTAYIARDNVSWVLNQAAIARHAYKVEILESHRTEACPKCGYNNCPNCGAPKEND